MRARVLFPVWYGVLAGVGFASCASAAAGTCGPAKLAIEADLCGAVGSQVLVEVRMTDAPVPIAGTQFFLEYSSATLNATSVGPADWPFVTFAADISVPGRITHASIVFGGSPTSEDTVIGRITFEVISELGERFIRFEQGHQPPTRLVIEGGTEILPLMVDLELTQADLRGFARLQNCFEINSEGLTGDCRCTFDKNGDDDIGLDDFRAFWARFAGPMLANCP